MPQGGGYRAVYIGQSVHHEPSDQTDLKNDIDAILGGGGGTFWKWADSVAHRGLGGAMMGLAGPTWQPLGVYPRGLPPRVF
jgi:hypothetical protein